MSAKVKPAASTGPSRDKPAKKANDKREVRILMLHGYTQSGALFRAKTRAVEKLLAKVLAPSGLVPVLSYPTGPIRLSARDVPGFAPPPPVDEGAAAEEEEQVLDSWSWFLRDSVTHAYRHLDRGMATLVEAIKEFPSSSSSAAAADSAAAAPSASVDEPSPEPVSAPAPAPAPPRGIDGVIGFSQGGCMAALLASALEGDVDGASGARRRGPPPAGWEGWVEELRRANGGRPLKFAVVYSGFAAPAQAPEEMGWFYYRDGGRDGGDGSGEGGEKEEEEEEEEEEGNTKGDPRGIRTPTLHYLGSLDTVVEESRSQLLIDRCRGPLVIRHPGGHHVPVSKEWVMPLAGFIKRYAE